MLEKVHELREIFYYLSPFDQSMVIAYAYWKLLKRKARIQFAVFRYKFSIFQYKLSRLMFSPSGIHYDRRANRRFHLVNERRVSEIARQWFYMLTRDEDDTRPTQL